MPLGFIVPIQTLSNNCRMRHFFNSGRNTHYRVFVFAAPLHDDEFSPKGYLVMILVCPVAIKKKPCIIQRTREFIK